MRCPAASFRARVSSVPLTSTGRGAAPTLGAKRQSTGGRELVVCLVLSVALFTLSCQSGGTGPLEMVRGAFQAVTSPVRTLGATVTAPLRGIGNVFANLTADQATLSELQAEVDELRARNAELEEDAGSARYIERYAALKLAFPQYFLLWYETMFAAKANKKRKVSVGEMYCKKPMIFSGKSFAPAVNNKSGTAVTAPAPASRHSTCISPEA